MRTRRTKAEKEYTLNEILKRKVAGKNDSAIRDELKINERNYYKYELALKDRFTNEMLSQRKEHFAESITIARQAIQQGRQILQEIMNDPKASKTSRVMAAKEDRESILFDLRIESEANTWADGLKQEMNMKVTKQVLPQDVIVQ